MKKKKKIFCRNKNYVTYRKMIILILDTMKGINSSNDRLIILRQNVEINSNEYVSCDVFFSGMKLSTTWLGNVIEQSPRKVSLGSELFQRFIMVYRTIIGVNFHFFIICCDWCCHFPFPLWARGPQRLGWGAELTHTATGEW